MSDCLRSAPTATRHYPLWQIGTGFMVSGMRRRRFIEEPAYFRRLRFSRAAPLPEYPRLAFNRAFQEPTIPLDMSLTVTERGRPVDMNFSLPSAGVDADPPSRVRRAMRSMVFRPAFVSCSEPVETELKLELAFID